MIYACWCLSCHPDLTTSSPPPLNFRLHAGHFSPKSGSSSDCTLDSMANQLEASKADGRSPMDQQLGRDRRVPMTFEAWMAICQAHPSNAAALQGQACLCDGTWPNALSATVLWRAWRVMNASRTDALSQRLVQAADQALAFRATLTPEQYVWASDAAARVPKHWRNACPEVDVLARRLEASEGREQE